MSFSHVTPLDSTLPEYGAICPQCGLPVYEGWAVYGPFGLHGALHEGCTNDLKALVESL